MDTRFEAGRQLDNALLGEAKKRLSLVKQSVWYTKAKKSTDKKERQAHFSAARQANGFSAYALEVVADAMRRTTWLGQHLDSHVAQKLADRAFEAVQKVALGKPARYDSKATVACIPPKAKRMGLASAGGVLNYRCSRRRTVDPVIQHGLSSRVKFVRLVRRDVHGQARYFAQRVCEGMPHRKRKHAMGCEPIGLDIGPSTIAIVGETRVELTMFAAGIIRDHKKIRRFQRKQNRQRRANNPECYDEKGSAIKGKPSRKKSRHQEETETVLAELHRKEAAHRKSLHGQLANQVMAMGVRIKTEKLSYQAFQKMLDAS